MASETDSIHEMDKKLPKIIPLQTDYNNLKNSCEATTSPYIIKVYRKRWLILLLFNLVAIFNAYQWVQYCIIGNIVRKYYGVSSLTVDFTSMVYLLVYLPFMYPASSIMDKKGLRVTLLLAAGGTCLGSWIKTFSIQQDLFYIGFTGQTIVALAQLFTLSTPARLAATWFGEKQVSTACALGVIGLQLGPAICFISTPLLVRDSENMSDIARDLEFIFWVTAIGCTITFISVIVFFKEEPELPPSVAQALVRKSNNKETRRPNTIESFKRLVKNGPFMSFTFIFGINVGAFCYLSTLLNPIILAHFPAGETFAGQSGLILTAAGIISSSGLGYILDKTRKFKETSVVVYILGGLGLFAFALSVGTQSKLLVLLGMLLAGFFLSGFFAVGFEVAAEMSYPESESNSSSFLNFSAQVLGILFTLVGGVVMDAYGDFVANMLICFVLTIGAVILVLTPASTKRQDALKANIKYDLAPQDKVLTNSV